eukprot:TRINITY_DN4415_c1_g1_i1.p1 TRINITY_DN4415_c1_g1~~TRINITY_DN4415_c1_g1_i1.p1  ORF type:complete len:1847 (+),score=486.34 TRINITY_DN4415_c1_g1_i1:83-5542(+)
MADAGSSPQASPKALPRRVSMHHAGAARRPAEPEEPGLSRRQSVAQMQLEAGQAQRLPQAQQIMPQADGPGGGLQRRQSQAQLTTGGLPRRQSMAGLPPLQGPRGGTAKSGLAVQRLSRQVLNRLSNARRISRKRDSSGSPGSSAAPPPAEDKEDGGEDAEEVAKAPREKGQIQARNFGVQLVQKLDTGLHDLAPKFAEHPWGMPCYAFVEAITNLLEEREKEEQLGLQRRRLGGWLRSNVEAEDPEAGSAPPLVSPLSDALNPHATLEMSAPPRSLDKGSDPPKGPCWFGRGSLDGALSGAGSDGGKEGAAAGSAAPAPVKEPRHRPPVPPEVRTNIQKFEQSMAVQIDRWLQQNGRTALNEVDLFSENILLAFGLWELFRGIDHKNTGVITWSAFTAYLIDSTMKGKVTSISEGFKQYTLTLARLAPPLYRMERITHVPALKSYLVLTRGKASVRAGSAEGQQSLRVVDSTNFQLRRNLPLLEEGGRVLAFAYCDYYDGLLALSYSDGRVRIYNFGPAETRAFEVRMVGPPLVGRFECAISRFAEQRAKQLRAGMSAYATAMLHTCSVHCPFITEGSSEDPAATFCAQTLLKWSPKLCRLFVGSKYGKLAVWDLSPVERLLMPGSPPHEPVVDWSLQVHQDAITDLSFLQEDQVIATSSHDGRVAVIHMEMRMVVRWLVPGRSSNPKGGDGRYLAGITKLAFSKRTNHLVSAGMEFEPLCWVINVPHSRPSALRDGRSPHQHNIVSLVAIPGHPQVVSMDLKGVVKVWDLAVMRCVQTLHCEPNVSRAELRALFWHDMVYNASMKQMVTSGKRKVYVFDYGIRDRNLDPDSAADYSIAAAVYTPYTHTFITVAKRNVRIWDGADGKQLRFFEEVCGDDVTVMCLDTEAHRFYVGTDNGEVLAFLYETATLVKRWQHPSECAIVSLQYSEAFAYILAVGADGTLMVVEEDPVTERYVGQDISRGRDKKIDAKCALLDPVNKVLLVGQGQNVITCFEMQRNPRSGFWTKRCDCTNTPQNTEVTCIVALGPNSAFCSADAAGGLHCWQLPPPAEGGQQAPARNIARWVNHHASAKVAYTPTVTHMAWLSQYCLLYTADDAGVINVYSLRPCLEAHGVLRTTFGDVLAVGAGPNSKILSVCQGLQGLRGRTRPIVCERPRRQQQQQQQSRSPRSAAKEQSAPRRLSASLTSSVPPSRRASAETSAGPSRPGSPNPNVFLTGLPAGREGESAPQMLPTPAAAPVGSGGVSIQVPDEAQRPRRTIAALQTSLKAAVDKAQQKPKLVQSWYAHQYNITALQLVGTDPEAPQSAYCVLTGGTDCNVTLWSLWGQRLSRLSKDRSEKFEWGLRLQKQEGEEDLDWHQNLYNDIPAPWNPLGRRTTEALGIMTQELAGDRRQSIRAENVDEAASFLRDLKSLQERCEREAREADGTTFLTDAQRRELERRESEARQQREKWRRELGADFEQLQAKLRAQGGAPTPGELAGEAAAVAAKREQLLQNSEPYNYRLLLRRHNPRAAHAQQAELQLLYAVASGGALPPEVLCEERVALRTPPRPRNDTRCGTVRLPPTPVLHPPAFEVSECESERERPAGCPGWMAAKQAQEQPRTLSYYTASDLLQHEYRLKEQIVVLACVDVGGQILEMGDTGVVVGLPTADTPGYCAEVQCGAARFWAPLGVIAPADTGRSVIYSDTRNFHSFLLKASASSRLPQSTTPGTEVIDSEIRQRAVSCPPLMQGVDTSNQRTVGMRARNIHRVHHLPPVHYRKAWQLMKLKSGSGRASDSGDIRIVSPSTFEELPKGMSVVSTPTITAAAPVGGTVRLPRV